jgi:hypothetical protein
LADPSRRGDAYRPIDQKNGDQNEESRKSFNRRPENSLLSFKVNFVKQRIFRPPELPRVHRYL